MTKKNDFIPLLHADQLMTYVDYLDYHSKNLAQTVREYLGPIDIHNHAEEGYLSRALLKKIFECLNEELSQEALVKMVVTCSKTNAMKFTNGQRIEGTVREALNAVGSEIKYFSTDTTFRLMDKLGEEWFYLDRMVDKTPNADLITALILVDLVQLVSGQNKWYPTKIKLRGSEIAKLKQAFPQSDIEYIRNQPFTSIEIPGTLLDMQIAKPTTDAIEASYVELHTFKYSLKKLLEPYVEGRIPTIEAAAEAANMSVRTMQRRLSKEGVSFSDVAHELLDEMACNALIGSNESIVDMSYRLGYSHSSHFIRAFKKKFELTPTQFREKYGKR